MAKVFAFMVLLARLVLSKEDELLTVDRTQLLLNNKDSPSYSFGYGVSNAQTGDVKTVWESKEGDTVKGHYSVLEADGSVRTVEYSASPVKGFTAEVINDGRKTQTPVTDQPNIEKKSFRDYHKPYDYSDDSPSEYYSPNDSRNKKRPYDSYYKDYSAFKRPSYNVDSESNSPDFHYSQPSKHLYDEGGYNREIHRHIGFTHDSNCKTKHTKDGSHVYRNLEDLDFRRHKNPFPYTNSYNYDKYPDSYSEDADKYSQRHKLKGLSSLPRPDEIGLSTSLRYSNPILPDVPPSESFYHDEIIQRPKKKYRPHKEKENYYPGEDLSEYVLVPKKKMKKPLRVPDTNDYAPDGDEDYDNSDYDDDRNRRPLRGVGQKEVVKKIVMKRRPPIMKFLDVLDI